MLSLLLVIVVGQCELLKQPQVKCAIFIHDRNVGVG